VLLHRRYLRRSPENVLAQSKTGIQKGDTAMENEDNLPTEVSRGIVKIGDLEMEVVQLDNGQRITTEESMLRFLAWLGSVIEGER